MTPPSLGALKLSVFASELPNTSTLGSDEEIVALEVGTSQALYSLPGFGVFENGASWTGRVPFALFRSHSRACTRVPVEPATRPFTTFSWRQTASSVESSFAPLGFVTWK